MLFKKKKQSAIKLGLGDKITLQQQKVNRALEVFVDAYEEVDTAQRELFSVIDEAEAQMVKLTNVLENAKAEFKANEGLKVKLAEFIPGKE